MTTTSNFASRGKGRGRGKARRREVGTDEGEGSQQSASRGLIFKYRTSGRIKQTARKNLGRIETIDLIDFALNTQ